MDNVYFMEKVKEDGSLTIPAFAMRGMGYEPGESVGLVLPVKQPDCGFGCDDDQLFIARGCSDAYCTGYTTEGSDVNIPIKLFGDARVPISTPFHIMAGDGALVLVAGSGDCTDLAEEIHCLLEELGIDVGACIPLGCHF